MARRAANSRLAGDIATRSQPKFKWTKWGVGIAGAVVNFFIENTANKEEDKLFDGVLVAFKKSQEQNKSKQQGINIVSIN